MGPLDIFEIPVYRRSPDEYWLETERLRDRYVSNVKSLHVDTGFWQRLSADKRNEEIAIWTASFNQSDDGKPWKYNDIVGYITLIAGLNQIKGEYWFVDAKRLRRDLKRKVFTYRDKVIEVWIDPQDSSKATFEMIRESILEVAKRKRFKDRHIDLEAFDNIGPYVDWGSLTSIA